MKQKSLFTVWLVVLAALALAAPGALAGPGDDTCDLATDVTLPHSEIMSIFPAGDHNWQSFTLSESSTVRIETLSEDQEDDTTLALYGGCSAGDPGGFIDSNDDVDDGFLSRIETDCLDPGTYYVDVGGFADSEMPDDFELKITVVRSCSLRIAVDIKPGSDPNSINTKNCKKGVIPVAILGSDTFDVTTVDVTKLKFGPSRASPTHDLTKPSANTKHLEDVNYDYITDLVSHYRCGETGIVSGDTEACLSGEMNDGGLPLQFSGCDSVRTVPPSK